MAVTAGSAPPSGAFSQIDLEGRRAVVVAVSGGSDSMALLVAAHEALAPQGVKILAVTIDHGLRRAARDEAEFVARFARSLEVDHRIVKWTGEKPVTGLAEAARLARYRLLDEVAREAGADMILAGHTMDDQAETVAMRAARAGDGWGRGAAGMAPATLLFGRTWLVRPFLGLRREALRDDLRRRGIGWVDDPTNDDPTHERVAARRALRAADRVADLAASADRAGEVRAAMAASAAGLLDGAARRVADGLVAISLDALGRAPRETALLAFATLVALAGGEPHLPRHDRAAAAFERLADGARRATLGRAVIEARGGTLFFRRELRNLPEPGPLAAGALWDGRFRALRALDRVAAGGGHATPQPVAGATARLVREAMAAEPDHGADALVPVAAPWADFLPAFDLPLAAAAARLAGADQALPACPVKDGRMPRPGVLGKADASPYFSQDKAPQA